LTTIANGKTPTVEFVANGRAYNYRYLLVDGIYPKWQTFVKPVVKPNDNQKVRNKLVFIMHKWRLVKMLREHLGFASLIFYCARTG
jgi:hypothetical protein